MPKGRSPPLPLQTKRGKRATSSYDVTYPYRERSDERLCVVEGPLLFCCGSPDLDAFSGKIAKEISELSHSERVEKRCVAGREQPSVTLCHTIVGPD